MTTEKIEKWVPWAVLGIGCVTILSGLAIYVAALGQWHAARDQLAQGRERTGAVMVTLAQCATDLEAMKGVMLGSVVPQFFVPEPPPVEMPLLGRGG